MGQAAIVPLVGGEPLTSVSSGVFSVLLMNGDGSQGHIVRDFV